MKVNLIPVIELPMPVGVWDTIGPTPPKPYPKYAQLWDEFLAKALSAAGYEAYTPVSEGLSFYRVTNISAKDVKQIINLHIAPLKENGQTIEDSCALFGGLALFVNEQLSLIPQCCSTLADVESWQAVIEDDFKHGYFCPEGHPMPEAKRVDADIVIRCHDEYEEFALPAPSSLIIPIETLRHAVEDAVEELKSFAQLVDSLSGVYQVEQLSRFLVWETS